MRLSFGVKITGIFLLIIACFVTALFIYLDRTLGEETFQRVVSRLEAEVALTQRLVEEAFVSQRTPDLDLLADRVGNALALRVTVIGTDGSVLGDSDLTSEEIGTVDNHANRPEVRAALANGHGKSKRFSTTIGKQLLYVARPFATPFGRGVVRLAVRLSDVERLSARLRQTLFIALLVGALLAALGSMAASFFMLRPIKEMHWVARSIAAGDFSKRAFVSSSDELADFARAFNRMIDRIRETIDEVTRGKSRLEAVLLSMFEGVMVVDLSGNITFINEPLRRVLQIEGEIAAKRPIQVIRNVEIQELADHTLRSGRGVHSTEITVRLPEERIFLVHATPIVRALHTEGAVLVFHDITDLRELERIRRDFVANVSHELRTPIASIKGYAETLLEGALTDTDNARDFVATIASDAERLAQLIDDLLNLANIESGKMPLAVAPCQIGPVIADAVNGLRGIARERNVSVENMLPELPPVRADRTRLSQVAFNLLDNAIKYNRAGGTVTVSGVFDEHSVTLTVSDTGIGIPEQDIPRIFERFYRVDKARSRELGGTGLGLSIVKHIVQLHGGAIAVRSVQGEGSSFSVTLPRA